MVAKRAFATCLVFCTFTGVLACTCPEAQVDVSVTCDLWGLFTIRCLANRNLYDNEIVVWSFRNNDTMIGCCNSFKCTSILKRFISATTTLMFILTDKNRSAMYVDDYKLCLKNANDSIQFDYKNICSRSVGNFTFCSTPNNNSVSLTTLSDGEWEDAVSSCRCNNLVGSSTESSYSDGGNGTYITHSYSYDHLETSSTYQHTSPNLTDDNIIPSAIVAPLVASLAFAIVCFLVYWCKNLWNKRQKFDVSDENTVPTNMGEIIPIDMANLTAHLQRCSVHSIKRWWHSSSSSLEDQLISSEMSVGVTLPESVELQHVQNSSVNTWSDDGIGDNETAFQQPAENLELHYGDIQNFHINVERSETDRNVCICNVQPYDELCNYCEDHSLNDTITISISPITSLSSVLTLSLSSLSDSDGVYE